MFNVEIYGGRTYCGNGFFDTFDECVKFFENDAFCDKAIITNIETGEVVKLKMKKEDK